MEDYDVLVDSESDEEERKRKHRKKRSRDNNPPETLGLGAIGSKRQGFAWEEEVEKEQDDQILEVVGQKCVLHKNDELAAKLHREEHLIPWNEDETLMIDPFDARGLLFDKNLFMRKKGFKKIDLESADQEEAELFKDLQKERYQDMLFEDEDEDEDEEIRKLRGELIVPINKYIKKFKKSAISPIEDCEFKESVLVYFSGGGGGCS